MSVNQPNKRVSKTDRDWEYFGQTESLLGGAYSRALSKENIDQEAMNEFFASGSAYVTSILDTVRTHVDPDFTPRKALDFGCGVGRLTVALAASMRKRYRN